jgi:lysophospholipase L1-like esterase
MDLLDDIGTWLHGCLGHQRDTAGVLAQRLTPHQASRCAGDDFLAPRAAGQPGISVALTTTAEAIELDLRLGVRSRPYLGLDVEIDGRVADCWRQERAGERFAARLLLPGSGRRQVRIHLPNSVACRLVTAKLLGDAAPQPLLRPTRRWLALGDSITQGLQAVSPAQAWTVAAARLGRLDLLNQAVGGHIYEDSWLDEHHGFIPDVVSIAYGTNDWSPQRPQTTIAATAARLYAAVRNHWPAARLVVVTPVWRHDETQVKGDGSLACLRLRLRDAAAAAGATVIDGAALIPNHPRCFADGVHPTEEGCMAMAAGILPHLL